MQTGRGRLVERFLNGGGRVACDARLIPRPGQYVMATASSGNEVLASPLFAARAHRDGFIAAPELPGAWLPGSWLYLRGPNGNGFHVPSTSRRVALATFGGGAHCLLPLVATALTQDAAVVFVGEHADLELPAAVEVQPLGAFSEAACWADYVAVEVRRETIEWMRESIAAADVRSMTAKAEVIVRTAMPCGGLAECGVCVVGTGRNRLALCSDGPVLDLRGLLV